MLSNAFYWCRDLVRAETKLSKHFSLASYCRRCRNTACAESAVSPSSTSVDSDESDDVRLASVFRTHMVPSGNGCGGGTFCGPGRTLTRGGAGGLTIGSFGKRRRAGNGGSRTNAVVGLVLPWLPAEPYVLCCIP
jgi:hypothetical protein